MSTTGQKRKVTIAIEGCCHGELDNIYGALQHLEKVEGRKVDLLISCGDFQAVRNMDDLETMACPPKYRDMHTFYKYYSGEKQAPVPTLFIGGNHEAANHLWELYYGGWAAPSIFFLGFAGAVKFGGVRIAGLSGIFKQGDYMKGHNERLPYDESTMRSIYHVRDWEHHRLMQIKEPVDIFLSHDWPRNIAHHGDKEGLLRRKSFLRQEIESGELGSPPAEQLLRALKPSYWFSAHMHVKFPALVEHADGQQTRFLALDKCLPSRDFLQVVELDATGPLEFEYDAEWLALMRTFHGQMNLLRQHKALNGLGRSRMGPSPADRQFVDAALSSRGTTAVPLNFTPTAPAFDASRGARQRGRMPSAHVRNPQTVALLEWLELPYNLDHADAGAAGSQPSHSGRGLSSARPWQQSTHNGGTGGQGQQVLPPPPASAAAAVKNPEEIELGDLDDEEQEDGDPGLGAGQTGAAQGGPTTVDSQLGDGTSAGMIDGAPPGQGRSAAHNPEEIELDDVLSEEEGEGAGAASGKGAEAASALADDPMFQPLGL